ILAGIRMIIDTSNPTTARQKFKFTRLQEPSDNEPPLEKTAQNPASQALTLSTSSTSVSPSASRDCKNDVTHTCVWGEKNINLYHGPPAQVDEVNKVDIFKAPFYPANLALDLETHPNPRFSKTGRLLKDAGEALDPFKGNIRLCTLADDDGNIVVYDLQK